MAFEIPSMATTHLEPGCVIKCWQPTPNVFVTHAVGHLSETCVQYYASRAERALRRGETITPCHHWLGVRGYSAEARRWITEWLARWDAQLNPAELLISSPLVMMGTYVANMETKRSVTVHSREEDFVAALARLIRQSTLPT
ncbi:hypothetical protein LZC95_39720 [Pendulispora brunnea]|uniref:Uncharacterized protein n=1 Tax=Pendulispora brunnea TaxID=2905690 RepID=A0ABZ2K1F2_9BACT